MKYCVVLVNLLIIFSCSKTPSDVPIGQNSSQDDFDPCEQDCIDNKEISIDGVIDDDWEPIYENTHDSNWNSNNDNNDFGNLYFARNNTFLFIAVSGGFSTGENTVNLYIDLDYQNGTGLNDFSSISGGIYGDHLRKEVTTPTDFGADIAFSVWAVAYDEGIVSLEDENNVDQNIIDEANIESNSSVIEFAIPFAAIYPDGEIPFGQSIALVAIIGGDNNVSIADDSIPQPAGAFSGNFTTVIHRAY